MTEPLQANFSKNTSTTHSGSERAIFHCQYMSGISKRITVGFQLVDKAAEDLLLGCHRRRGWRSLSKQRGNSSHDCAIPNRIRRYLVPTRKR